MKEVVDVAISYGIVLLAANTEFEFCSGIWPGKRTKSKRKWRRVLYRRPRVDSRKNLLIVSQEIGANQLTIREAFQSRPAQQICFCLSQLLLVMWRSARYGYVPQHDEFSEVPAIFSGKTCQPTLLKSPTMS